MKTQNEIDELFKAYWKNLVATEGDPNRCPGITPYQAAQAAFTAALKIKEK
jgi:hypothetical protein